MIIPTPILVSRKWLNSVLSLCDEAMLRLEQLDIDDPGIYGAIMEITSIVQDKVEEAEEHNG